MRLDSIGTLFSNAWKRYQQRFVVIFPIFLIPLALLGWGNLLIAQQTLSAIALGEIFNFFGALLAIVAAIAVIAAIGKKFDFAKSYQIGFSLFWAEIWIEIIAGFAILGGFIMLIIPGILLAIQLAFRNYSLVLDGKYGMEALTASREYLKGYWWAFLGRTLLLGICFGALMFILYLPFKVLAGSIVGDGVYGLLLLLFVPFSFCYNFEIYENLQRVNPKSASVTPKADQGFLKVSLVVGIVGSVLFAILCVLAIVFFPTFMTQWRGEHLNRHGYAYPVVMATSTVQMSPTSGPVGTNVLIADSMGFDATNTILMNGYLAARNVSVSTDGNLTFAIPASLAPNCDAHQVCPQFLISVRPSTTYEVMVVNSEGTINAGIFTVTETK